MSLAALAIAFALITLTEMGDKTQLVAVSFASRYNPAVIFAAVLSALAAVTALGVALGTVIFTYVPVHWIRLAAAVLFIGFGIWTWASREEHDDDPTKAVGNKALGARVFAITFIAEMGDKTQLTAIALTSSYAAPVEVFVGAVLGFALVTAVGVWVGRWLGKRFDKGLLAKASAILFLVIGVYMLAEVLLQL